MVKARLFAGDGRGPPADVQTVLQAECPSSDFSQVVSEGHEHYHARIAPSGFPEELEKFLALALLASRLPERT
jgi:hypothetical protein